MTMVREQVRVEYESTPAADAVADIAARREALLREKLALEAEIKDALEERGRLHRELDRKSEAFKRLHLESAHAEAASDDRHRILEHSGKVRDTLGAFRRAVIERDVGLIEQLVLESYQQLLRKTWFVAGLTIDPMTFCLTLLDRHGEVINMERLSAGERQLLAIALLWGLAKASGRSLPIAIDTPLGRLDSSHRIHMVERYLPFAGDQVLLFSTDEEISGEYLERLRPWIGRTYHLMHDEAVGSTRIEPGYFPLPEVA
jgi:DNA sulfur modification protein DndD